MFDLKKKEKKRNVSYEILILNASSFFFNLVVVLIYLNLIKLSKDKPHFTANIAKG